MLVNFKVLIVLPTFFSIASFGYDRKWKIREPIDLTLPINEHSIVEPGAKPLFYTRRKAGNDDNGNWYAVNEFCIPEHIGTHLDAPYHFHKFGWKVADIPIERLLTHAVVIDMSRVLVSKLRPTGELQESDLRSWERVYGPMPPHCVILVRFGWLERYGSTQTNFGFSASNESNMVFPGISVGAARWLVESRKIFGVGVDIASVNVGSRTGFGAHKILAQHNIYHLENVNIPKGLPPRGFNLLILPMKLMEGTGAPLRILAIPEGMFSLDAESDYEVYVNTVPWYAHISVVLASLLLLGMYIMKDFSK